MLNRIIILIISTAFLAACNQKKDYVLLSGKVVNATTDKIILYSNDREQKKEITIGTEGNFRDTIHNIEGYCFIELENSGETIYLEKGQDLELTINLNKPSLVFSGGTLKEGNKLIKEIEKDSNQALEKIGLQKLFTLSEKAFIVTIDSITQVSINAIENANIPEKLAKNEKKKIAYNKYYIMSVYPNNYSIFTGKDNYTPSEKFKKAQGEISYDKNEDYNQLAMYRSLVKEHYTARLYKAEKKEERKKIITEIKNSPIKKLSTDFALKLMPSISNTAEEIEENIENIKYLTSNPKVLEQLEKNIEYISALGKGVSSPKFTFEDINGKKVSLDDLKGKLVYIDVWATWCGPCKDELPFLQKIEQAYHNRKISFVSISVDEDHKAWKNMVKKEKLGGIQLIAAKSWKSSFVEAYRIQGIPRFILIDSKGKIISANAPRPSSADLLLLIEEELAKI